MNICSPKDKILYSVSSFIIARNEEDNIGRTIDSDDVASFTRPLRMYPDKAFNRRKCSYALGSSLPFALIKALGMGTDGFHFMKGYLSMKDVEKHEDIAKFVKKQQYERGFDKINRVYRGANESSLTRWNNS